MHLIVNVEIRCEAYRGEGKLLLTERSAFFFRRSIIRRVTKVSPFVHAFGLLGAIVALAIDPPDERFPPPEHLKDPEIRAEPACHGELFNMNLIHKLPLDRSFPPMRKKDQFAFESADGVRVQIKSSWVAYRISEFLSRIGIRPAEL
jgi:hypothetical protein